MRTEKLNPTQYQLAIEDPISASGRAILFDLVNSVWVTNTVRMAQALGKRNKNIMNDFKRLHKWSYDTLVDGRNIQPGSYLDGNNQSRPMWLVDGIAFATILSCMTGTIANRYSTLFANEFYSMRETLNKEQINTLSTGSSVHLIGSPEHYVNDATNLYMSQFSGNSIHPVISMSEFAMSLNKTNMNIDEELLYALLRNEGLVQQNKLEPTKVGLEYLVVDFKTINGTIMVSSSVLVSRMIQLVVIVQKQYIDTYIANNNLTRIIEVLQQIMCSTTWSNDDLISYLKTNLPTLQYISNTL